MAALGVWPSLQRLAITLFYVMTFFLAAWLKWSQGVPPWFEKQFAPTWMATVPGGLATIHYFLAVLETVAVLGFCMSLFRGEFVRAKTPFLKASLTFSLFLFIIFAYGSRLTQRMDVAGWNYVYFIGTLLALYFFVHDPRQHPHPTPAA